MLIIGCGSSLHAGLFAQHIFKHLDSFNTIQVIDASDFTKLDIPKQKPGAILISQSGETRDVYLALKKLKEEGVFTMAISIFLLTLI